MRDALPEDMQNIYYIAGGRSTIAIALCTLGVGAVAIYGSLNKMQSEVESQQHVRVDVGSEGGTVTQGYSNFADGMSPEDVAKYIANNEKAFFNSPVDGAVFWSGNKEGAATYANSIGGTKVVKYLTIGEDWAVCILNGIHPQI